MDKSKGGIEGFARVVSRPGLAQGDLSLTLTLSLPSPSH
jgi:hypothetical protein